MALWVAPVLFETDAGDMMKVAKIVGGGCLGLIVLVGAIIGIVFYATSGITDTTDEFFAAVSDGDYETAQTFTSQRLRESTSVDELREFVVMHRLENVVDTSWSNRSIQNNTGELSGTVETESGAVIPMTILMIHEADVWRIDGFDIETPTLPGSQSQRSVPDRTEAQATANARIDPEAIALADGPGIPGHMWLNTAWMDGDYLLFANTWKDRPSPQSLAARYPSDGLSAEEIEFLDDVSADIETAQFDEEGNLVVGYVRHLPNRAVRTVFTYVNVPGATHPWQIADLEVDKGTP